MKEKTKEFYIDLIKDNAEKIAEILENGEKAELLPSRSGLKMYAIRREHIVLNCRRAKKTRNEG